MKAKLFIATVVLLFGLSIFFPASSILAAPEDTANSAEATSTAEVTSCYDAPGALNWILCPVLEGVDKLVTWLDVQLINLLNEPMAYFEADSSGNNPSKEAASRIQRIAIFLLVPITLVMVIGTALGFDFISAYTIKRALPRLVFAVIFIALSWDIVKFMVDITNAAGRGVYGIIISAFTGQNADNITLATVISGSGFGANSLAGLSALAAGTVGAGAAIAFLGMLCIGLIPVWG